MNSAAGSPTDVTRGRLTFQYTALEMIRQYKMRQEIKSTGQEMKDESVQMEAMAPEYEHIEPDDPTQADQMNAPGPWQCLPKRKVTQSYINQQALIYAKLCEELQKLIENSKSNAQNSSGTANMNEGAGEAVTQHGNHRDWMEDEPMQDWWNDTEKMEAVIRYCREVLISHTMLWNFKNEVLRVILEGTGVIVRALISSQSTDIQILTGLGEMLFKLLLDHISFVYESNGGPAALLTPRLPLILKDLASFIVRARNSEDFDYDFEEHMHSELTYEKVYQLMGDKSTYWDYKAFKAFTEDICSGMQILSIELANCVIVKGR